MKNLFRLNKVLQFLLIGILSNSLTSAVEGVPDNRPPIFERDSEPLLSYCKKKFKNIEYAVVGAIFFFVVNHSFLYQELREELAKEKNITERKIRIKTEEAILDDFFFQIQVAGFFSFLYSVFYFLSIKSFVRAFLLSLPFLVTYGGLSVLSYYYYVDKLMYKYEIEPVAKS